MKAIALIVGLLIAPLGHTTPLTEDSILGVWELTKFVLVDSSGEETPWCEGATGSIAYLPGNTMTVGINCEGTRPGSSAEALGGLLFYSGFFEVDTQGGQVLHRVRNSSDPSLNKTHRREVSVEGDLLRLSGPLGEGGSVVVEWTRVESFKHDRHPITGVWELVGSENQIPGQGDKIPFCHGFHGNILYTPGGYTSVSINCGEPKDPEVSEPADAFGRRFFYNGTYRIEGDVAIQTPDNASATFLIGEDAIRQMRFEDDLLILEGVNGSRFVAKWRKRSSFTGLQ